MKDPTRHPAYHQAKRLAKLLDSAFEIPIIRKRIGLDPLLGLIPGAGDVVAALLSMYILWVAYQLDCPVSVWLRMLANTLLDMTVGSVPVVGDVLDTMWKANLRNLELLEKAYLRHGEEFSGIRSRTGNSGFNGPQAAPVIDLTPNRFDLSAKHV